MRRPSSVPVYSRLNTGVLYTVRVGDNIPFLAQRFYTTAESIMSVNPEIESVNGTELQAGTEMCLLPSVCDVTCRYGMDCEKN